MGTAADTRPTLSSEPPIPEHHEPPRPAARSAVNNLEEQLLKLYSPGAARALARSVVDPTEVRRQLQHPTWIRSMGGTSIAVIYADVWTHTVSVYPANPRESEDRPLAIQGDPGPYPRAPRPAAGGRNELVVRVATPTEFGTSQAHSASWLVSNNDYREEIRDNGVLRHILLVATRIVHTDGSPDIHVATAGDGSSRTASAQHLLGVRAEDVVYTFSVDDREMRRLIGDVRADAILQSSTDTSGTPRAVRALTMPAAILVDCAGGDVTDGLRGYLGLQHVSPPRRWGETGEVDVRADAALSEMEKTGLDAQVRDWFEGTLPPDEAARVGLSPLADQRSAWILSEVIARQDAARGGVLRVDNERKRVRRERLCEIAADLSLRACRSDLLQLRSRGRTKPLKVAREALRLINEYAWDKQWNYTGLPVEALRDGAIREVRDGQGGSFGIELGLLAAYHLTRLGMVREIFFHEKLRFGGRPSPDEVIRTLLHSDRGVHQLAQVVIDCRADRPPRKVAYDGSIVRATTTTPTDIELTDDDLYRELVGDGTWSPEAPVSLAVKTPERELLESRGRIADFVRRARVEMAGLSKVVDGAPALIDVAGWPRSHADEIQESLSEMTRRLNAWSYVWERRERDRVDDETEKNTELIVDEESIDDAS